MEARQMKDNTTIPLALNRYHRFISGALKHVDAFVPPTARKSDTLFYGYRFVAGILLSAFLYMLLVAAIISQITALSSAGRTLFIVAAAILATGAFLGLVVLRFSGKHRLPLNLFIFSITLAISYTSSLTGGLTSPVNSFILVVPALATLALGTRTGALWSAGIAVTGLLLLWCHSAGLTPPSIIAVESQGIAACLAMMSAHIFLALIVIYYNIAADRLRRQLNQERRRYQNLAHHDSLTGLANRRYFIDKISAAITTGEALGACFSILYFDLNRFKEANDHYGHHFGDKVLIEFGRRLAANTRHSDCVARLGGDEFSILLDGVSNADTIRSKLRQISDALEKPIYLEGVNFVLSASAGYAIFPKHGRDYETLLRRADREMYSVKPGRLLPPESGPSAK